jgi:hypothetical protein
MNTCKDCKWWGASFMYEGLCHHPLVGVEYRDPPEVNNMLSVDSVGVVVVIVGADFGCIHWEAKESEDALP